MDFTLKSDENHTLVSVSLLVRDPPRVSWHKQDWARDMVFNFVYSIPIFQGIWVTTGKYFLVKMIPLVVAILRSDSSHLENTMVTNSKGKWRDDTPNRSQHWFCISWGVRGLRRRRRATPYFFRHHAISYGWHSNSSVGDSNYCYVIRRTY